MLIHAVNNTENLKVTDLLLSLVFPVSVWT